MHKLAIVAATTALALAPISAYASNSADHLAAKTPKAPGVGHWKVVNITTGPEVTGGSLVVTKGHTDIRSVVIKLGTDADTACGAAGDVFKVAQRQKLYDAKGTNLEFGGKYNEWAVGKNDPSADPVIQPRVVTLTINGKARKADYWMVFQHGTKGNGEITFNHQQCDLDFGVRKG